MTRWHQRCHHRDRNVNKTIKEGGIMKQVKILTLVIIALSVACNVAFGYDPYTGRFQQQDPVGTGPRIVSGSHGPRFIGLNGPTPPNPNMQTIQGIPIAHIQATIAHNPQTAQAFSAVGANQYDDGMSTYQYTGSNPVNRVDPMGTDFIAIADREIEEPIVEKLKFRHYSLQYWECCKKFVPLGHTSGFKSSEIVAKCKKAKKIASVELRPIRNTYCIWYGHDMNEGVGPKRNKWRRAPVSISVVHFNDSADKIMPVYDDNRGNVAGKWLQLMESAKNYPYAETAVNDNFDGNFWKWPWSHYYALGTNSNTFVRYIAGGLMTEMEGNHPGHYSPHLNANYGISDFATVYADQLPFKCSEDRPCPSYDPE